MFSNKERMIRLIIKKCRMISGTTQDELAEELGIDARQVRYAESLGTERAEPSTISLVLEYYGLEFLNNLKEEHVSQIAEAYIDKIATEEELMDVLAKLQVRAKSLIYNSNSCPYKEFPIVDLIDFLIYYPVMNPVDLHDAIYRISANFENSDYYVLSQLEYVYDEIEESKAFDFAKRLRQYNRSCNITQIDTDGYAEYMERVKLMYSCSMQIHSFINTYKELFVNKDNDSDIYRQAALEKY